MRVLKSSPTLEQAQRRLERLKAIQPPLQSTDGISISDFEVSIHELELMQAEYNAQVSQLDSKASAMKVKEKEIRDYRERMLSLIAAKFGKDSEEYVTAGGVRKSERKKPQPKAATSAQNKTN